MTAGWAPDQLSEAKIMGRALYASRLWCKMGHPRSNDGESPAMPTKRDGDFSTRRAFIAKGDSSDLFEAPLAERFKLCHIPRN